MIEIAVETLNERLHRRITSEGPITFAEFMRAALYDPADGYYCRAGLPKWGRQGDYRTSPERSELFPATFARYFARFYEELGRPSSWTIVEAGAGAGYFARGVLTTLKRFFPDVFAVTRYVVDEIGVNSQKTCREMTAEFSDRVEFQTLSDLKVDLGVVFSNELLDALPVHRVTLSTGLLKEFFVAVDSGGQFEWVLDTPSTAKLQEYFDLCGVMLVEGQVAEVCLDAESWLRSAASTLRRGYIVTVDYGASAQDLYAHSLRPQGTLRAFRDHSLSDDVLNGPGDQDLTTTVNWTFIERVGQQLGLEVVDFKQQDKFLLEAGLLSQLESESAAAGSDAKRLLLSTSAREMILPHGMAAKFQVMVQRKSTLCRAITN